LKGLYRRLGRPGLGVTFNAAAAKAHLADEERNYVGSGADPDPAVNRDISAFRSCPG